MPTARIAITLDRSLLNQLDRMVKKRRFPNRSQAVQAALRDTLRRLRCLEPELAKVDPKEEREMAEEWFVGERELWAEES